MRKPLARLSLIFKTARQLGLEQSGWYAVYQLGLRSGHYRRALPADPYPVLPYKIRAPFTIPARESLAALVGSHGADLLGEADEIAQGQVRLFGGPPAPLELRPPDASLHWTAYEGHPARWGVEDIKLAWEPARFGWVYPLGRAYRFSGDERYPQAFWEHFETFLSANPLNQGPNWSSAQEVALRTLALLFAAGVFEPSPHSTPARMSALAGAVAAHAGRIPPTLSYARAQNNNHWISEGLGLYAAGLALAEHPQAKTWLRTGWEQINRALQKQIAPDGTYAQHSMNYHRLMLHAALQARLLGRPFPASTNTRLAAATTWLLAQVDPLSGRAPNLGNNDGANILPLACAVFSDYRPVAQAAARAFLGQPAFAPGPWDELGLWLGQDLTGQQTLAPLPASPAVQKLGDTRTWATLRAVHFDGRPAHADQLHVDLWWRGENIALDAGTFRYTAPAPWDNPLAETRFHNTLTINGQNQMLRAGRFRWLDWAQARCLALPGLTGESIAAEQDGYRRLGVLHRRILSRAGLTQWQVTDHLLPVNNSTLAQEDMLFRLHWLLPDWPWEFEGLALRLTHPGGGHLRLVIAVENQFGQPLPRPSKASLVRAGQILAGSGPAEPAQGWFSPTYQVKIPALSFELLVHAPPPLTLRSDWLLEAPDV